MNQCTYCGEFGHHESAHYSQMGEAVDPMLQDPYSDEIITTDEIIEPNMQTQSEVDAVQEFIPEVVSTGAKGVASDLMMLAQAASSQDADTILTAVEKFSKSQLVRFLDISVIGPFLLLLAYRGKIGPVQRLLLGLTGAGTILYNYRNWKNNRAIIQPQALADLKAELETSLDEGEGRAPLDQTIAGYYAAK